jgi:uncharacterized protein (TIGR00730 family)
MNEQTAPGIDFQLNLRTIAVYSGSNFGVGDDYRNAAALLGRTLAAKNLIMVYGGTNKGLMGIVADAALQAGGEVHGVITQRLADRGHTHPSLTRHELLLTMRERKARMADLADAFIALPGGIGTLEEFAEVWTLNQLGEFHKPVGLLNINGFYDPFMVFIDKVIAEGFLPSAYRQSVVVEADPERMLEKLARHQPTNVPKWL